MFSWSSFSRDPRKRAHARLSVSAADAALAEQILKAGYADGKLDRDEYEDLRRQVMAATQLRQLPPILGDVLDDPGTTVAGPVYAGQVVRAPLLREAEKRYERRRRSAISSFLTSNLFCWTIFILTSVSFPWPIFVTIGTGIYLFNTLTGREQIVEEELKQLTKKEERRERRITRQR